MNENIEIPKEKDSASSSVEREINKFKMEGEKIVEPAESLKVESDPKFINRSSTDVNIAQTDLKSSSEDTDFLPKAELLSIPMKEDCRNINDISVSPQRQQSSRNSVDIIEKTGNPENIAGKNSDPSGIKRPPSGLYAKLKAKTMSSSLIASAQKKESNKSPVNNTPVGVSTESNISSEVSAKTNEKADINSNTIFKKASIESKTISSSKSNITPQAIETSPLSEKRQSAILLPVTEKAVDNSTAINSKMYNQISTDNSKPSSSKLSKSNFNASTFSDTSKSMTDETVEAGNDKTCYHQGLIEQQNLNKNNDTKLHEHKNEKIADIAKLKVEFSKDKKSEAIQKELNNSGNISSEKKSPVYDPNKVIVFPDEKTITDHRQILNLQNRRNTVPSNFLRKPFEKKVENTSVDPKQRNDFQTGNSNNLKLSNRNPDSNPSNIDTIKSENTKSEEQGEQNTKNMTQLGNKKSITGFNPNEVIQFPDQKKPEETDNQVMNYKDILAANRSSLQTRVRNSSFLMKHEKNEEQQKLKQNITKQQHSLEPHSGNNNKNQDVSSKSSAISPREKLIKNIEDHGIPTLAPGNVPDTTKATDHATVSSPTKPHTKKQMTKTDYVFTITNVRRDESAVLDKKPPNIRQKPVKQNSQDNEVGLGSRSMSVGHFIHLSNAKKAPPQVMKKPIQKTHSGVGFETNIKPSDLFSKPTTLPVQNRVVNPQNYDLR